MLTADCHGEALGPKLPSAPNPGCFNGAAVKGDANVFDVRAEADVALGNADPDGANSRADVGGATLCSAVDVDCPKGLNAPPVSFPSSMALPENVKGEAVASALMICSLSASLGSVPVKSKGIAHSVQGLRVMRVRRCRVVRRRRRENPNVLRCASVEIESQSTEDGRAGKFCGVPRL